MKRDAKREKLGEYRRKRDGGITNEPMGGDIGAGDHEKTLRGAYVVHLHDATRRHYDLRLEVGGVLTSFAVPHGPSLDPEARHLAMKTEDHPIEYLEFEDVIPEKQYGAGPMIAWDRGSVEYLEGPAEEEIASGKLHVELRGLKLHGRYALVKLAKGETGNEWLLFKKADEHASRERNIVEELPRSVLSGLTVEELLRVDAIRDALTRSARALGAKKAAAESMASLFGGERQELAIAAPGAPAGSPDAFVFDPDFDGVRVLALRDADAVTLVVFDATGASLRVEAFYPEVVRALRSLPVTRLALDGELVAFDRAGRPSVRLLAQRAQRIAKGDIHEATTSTPVVLMAKDLLCLEDLDIRPLALAKRRELLAKVVPALGFVRATPPLEGALDPVVTSCAEHGIGTVIAKPRASAYATESRRNGWVSIATGVSRGSRVAIDHRAAEAEKALRKVTVTNRTKVFWPGEGLTKGDLCDYYVAIAGAILPFLVERPLILVRYPDGIEGKSFYQWNVPPGMPSWIRTLTIGEGDDARRGFLVDDPTTLLYIANLGCIPLHILASRVPHLEHSDFFTVDFDVKQSELRHAVTLAKTLKGLLDEIGLASFPKTSGQSGLHVLVPLGGDRKSGSGRQTHVTARALADLLGTLLVQRHPDIATMERVVSKRGPRVYVDTGQTGTTRAIVAPYSVRAVAGARVSTPLAWSEVEHDLDPAAFTIETVPARMAKIGDPMKGMLDRRPDVGSAVAKLAELVAKG
ncbi:MAG: DNA ligase [Deltaproteobacteria bacterium]|nr:DNA ligase [Deltaproteobacteria bacterium]